MFPMGSCCTKTVPDVAIKTDVHDNETSCFDQDTYTCPSTCCVINVWRGGRYTPRVGSTPVPVLQPAPVPVIVEPPPPLVRE